MEAPKIISSPADGTARKFAVSTAPSRSSLVWKREAFTWSEFVTRLSETVRTPETTEEYANLSKDAQGRIKDVGGYVGGLLKDGRRKKNNVISRTLLTLDLDFPTPDVTDRVERALPASAWVLHSTHSSIDERPRLRLIAPLSRTVGPGEYEILASGLIEFIGAEMCDPTTIQPERLMYWPSTPSDGSYFFRSHEGFPIDADLWVDPSLSPSAQLRSRTASDPRTKPGYIGAFNRIYTVPLAIAAFLHTTYLPTPDPTRYTYAHGTTTGGALIFDDGLFILSFHASDPVQGRLLSAYDLVRLHLYGVMDASAEEGTDYARLPSQAAMQVYCETDPAVKEEYLRAKREEVNRYILEGTPPGAPSGKPLENNGSIPVEGEDPDGWVARLIVQPATKVEPARFVDSYYNVDLIMRNDPAVKGRFSYDEFAERLIIRGDVPWHRGASAGSIFSDEDEAQLRVWISTKYYKLSNRQAVTDVLTNVSRSLASHPVREYLSNLSWDGTPRVSSLCKEVLGAEDSKLNNAMLLCWLKAAVARVFHPGTKFDNMLVLAGPQGCGKSTFAERLGKHWYSSTLLSLKNIRQASAQILGSWIIEDPELTGINSSGAEFAKGFLSKTVDDFIVPYGRRKIYKPRQCVFLGTTNQDDFLSDHTGERRYWVIPCTGAADTAHHPYNYFTPFVVDQIWAEVVALYREDPTLIIDKEDETRLRYRQRSFADIDVWYDDVDFYLHQGVPRGWDEMTFPDKIAFIDSRRPGDDPADLEPVRTVTFRELLIVAVRFPALNLAPKDARRRINKIMARFEDWTPAVMWDKSTGKSVRGWKLK